MELLNQNRYDLILSDLRMPAPQEILVTGNAATGEYATFWSEWVSEIPIPSGGSVRQFLAGLLAFVLVAPGVAAGGERTDSPKLDWETGEGRSYVIPALEIGGAFMGEAAFRMASLLLEGGGEKPGFWRELGAAIFSPPTGFNRLVFGDRFDE